MATPAAPRLEEVRLKEARAEVDAVGEREQRHQKARAAEQRELLQDFDVIDDDENARKPLVGRLTDSPVSGRAM